MMEDPTPLPPVVQKRPLEEDLEHPTAPVTAVQSGASSPLSERSMQTPSPMKTTTSGAATSTSANHVFPSQNTSSTTAQQPAKRRKLTQQEKDDLRLEKEAKAKARDEKRLQKEAEEKLKAEQKAQKEEERRLKEEEKQKKNEEREEKRRQKEEEQQQKEEEKAKKERSQMKLNAFFTKPKTTGVNPVKASVESAQHPIAPASLLPTASAGLANAASSSPQKNVVKNAQSDYERYFLPFSLPAHTILAPRNAFMDDMAKIDAARQRLDNLIAQENGKPKSITVRNLQSLLSKRGRRGLKAHTVAEVVEFVNSSSEQAIDLTTETASNNRPLDMLKEIPMKYIHFGEDVRPPYYGTYTQPYTEVDSTRLARNPLCRVRKDTNYDYDSEAEWEEPEEGEDLDSEEEDDAGEDVEDDMDEFLDDEEDPLVKRRLVSGDLQPVSTGLCWQDTDGVSRLNDGSGAICTDFREFSMGFLLEPQPHAIDPFSTAYWTSEPSLVVPPAATAAKDNTMNPPRAPLTQRTMNGLLNTFNTASRPAKAKRMIPCEQLPAFKAEIDGKDLTKIGMIEALKKVFPKLPKDAITNTLSVVAARVGPTEKEKRWVLINS